MDSSMIELREVSLSMNRKSQALELTKRIQSDDPELRMNPLAEDEREKEAEQAEREKNLTAQTAEALKDMAKYANSQPNNDYTNSNTPSVPASDADLEDSILALPQFRSAFERWAIWGTPLIKFSWLLLFLIQVLCCSLIIAISPDYFINAAILSNTSNNNSTLINYNTNNNLNTADLTFYSGISSGQHSGAITLVLILGSIQIAILLAASAVLYVQILMGTVSPLSIGSMFLSVILIFAHAFLSAYVIDPSSFTMAYSGVSFQVFGVWVTFAYLSTTIITTTGLGDVVPLFWYPKLICAAEMIVGVIYTACIFSIGVDHFRLNRGKRSSPKVQFGIIASWFRKIRNKYPGFDKIRRFCVEYVLVVSIVVQILLLCFIYAADKDVFQKERAGAGVVIVVLIFEILQFVLVILMTLSLVRQINTSLVSPSFLFQSYLSTVFQFAGIYFAIYLINGWNTFHFGRAGPLDSTTAIVETAGLCAWMSLVLMTTTGFGDVFPQDPFARLIVMFQMLCSVFYSVVILGLGMAHIMGAITTARDERKKKILEKHANARLLAAAAQSTSPLPTSASSLNIPLGTSPANSSASQSTNS